MSATSYVYNWGLPWNSTTGCTSGVDIAELNAREKAKLVVPLGVTVTNPPFLYVETAFDTIDNALIVNPISPIYLKVSPVLASVTGTTLTTTTTPNLFTYLPYEDLLNLSSNLINGITQYVPVQQFDISNLLFQSNTVIPAGYSFSNITWDVQISYPCSSRLLTSIAFNFTNQDTIGYIFAGTGAGSPIYYNLAPSSATGNYAVLTQIARENATVRLQLTFPNGVTFLQNKQVSIFFNNFTGTLLTFE